MTRATILPYMQDPAYRTRQIFLYSTFFVICTLALLFIFFFVTSQCGQILLAAFGTDTCLIGVSWFWLEGAFLVIAVFSLYRVNTLMAGGP
jgi:hypothetical protein